MTLSEAPAKRIDFYLFSRGITLYKLAKEAELPLATLQNLYRGNMKSPTLAIIFKVANGLHVTVEEFLSDEIFHSSLLELD